MTEKWKPTLDNTVQPTPTFKLLKKGASKIFRKFGIFPIKAYYDNFGRWGFRYRQFLYVAKQEVYGNIVSVHEEAVLEARKYQIGIVMWLDSAGKFYWFNPEEIDKNSEKNYKGGVPMLNFNIKLAKSLDW